MVRKLMTAASRRPAIAAAAAVAGMLLPAGNAIAGSYDVYSCRIPYGAQAGEPAPVQVSSEEAPGRWSYAVTGTANVEQTCASGGNILAMLPANTTHTEVEDATWQFTAPAGENIVKATLWRAGDAEGGSGYLYWLAAPEDSLAHEFASSEDIFDGCVYTLNCREVGTRSEPLAEQNELKVPGEYLGGSHIYFNAGCSGAECPSSTGDAEHYAAVVHVYATDLTLEQEAGPSVSGLSGELDTATSVSGEASLDFEASDPGSGVYQAILKVDGAVVSEQVLNEEKGRCRAVEAGPDGLPAFLYAQPCPSSVSGNVSLDTTKLSDGEHTLTAVVTDAAGNETTALKRQIDVANGSGEGEGAEGGEGGTSGGQPEGGAGGGSEGGSGAVGEGGASGGASGGGSGAGNGGGASGSGSSGAGGQAGGAGGGSSPSTPPTLSNGVNASLHAKLTVHWVRPRRRRHSKRSANRSRSGHSGRHARSGKRGARRGGSVLRTGFGAGEAIAGRLTAQDGKPIEHATVTVSGRPLYGGSKARKVGSASTGRNGRFVLHLASRSPSQTITLSYAPSEGAEGTVSRRLTLRVRAGVRLHVSPRRTSAGHAIRLTGSVLGRPIPEGGKQVVLEARSKGTGWLKFDVVRTDAKGRFSASHRFRLPGPVRYTFRAVCPHEADFPFETGTSNVVGVWEM